MLNNKKVVAALAGLAVLVAAVAFWMLRDGGAVAAIDLIGLLPQAQSRSHVGAARRRAVHRHGRDAGR